tara:strand:+ start:194 stop:784 length:591 start_codon:yes stop_codon:yes gene_type:complete
MIDKKDKEGKVLIGPWGEPKAKNDADADKWIKEKYDRELNKKNTQLKMKEKLSRVDMITENIMIQLIHTLGEYDYEIGKDDFILDVGFLSETVKAVISRQERIPHVVQGLIDNLMTPEKTKDDRGQNIYYSRFNSPLLNELIEMANEIRETPTDVIFEPDMELDTEPEEISGWKVDIDKEDKDKDDKDDDNGGKEF